MKLRDLLILSAFGLAATTAHAQSGAAPTARQIELSHQIIEATGAAANYDKLMGGIMHQIFAQAMKGQSQQAQQSLVNFEKAEEQMMLDIKPKMFSVMENVYATTYTEPEMEGLLAFYKSPAGAALVAKSPLLSKNMMGGIASLMPEMKTAMISSLCDSMHCTPAQRQTLSTNMSAPHA